MTNTSQTSIVTPSYSSSIIEWLFAKVNTCRNGNLQMVLLEDNVSKGSLHVHVEGFAA